MRSQKRIDAKHGVFSFGGDLAKGVDHEHATVEGVVAAAGAGSAGDGGDGFVSAPVDEVA